MTIEQMKARKRELGLSNKELAQRSGVPLGTVQKIMSGATVSPRMTAILKLEKVLQPAMSNPVLSDREIPADGFREAGFVYGTSAERKWPEGKELQPEKKQGEYTLEDYYAIPDDRRVELIDGVIYDMASPGNIHQALSSDISWQLQNYVSANHGKCMVYTAPFDVQLDMDNRTMVEPDIVVICNYDRLKRFGCFGAPEFVIEILSPSTRKKDVTIKIHKYMNAGVQEYWIVDPRERNVTVILNEEEGPAIHWYTFADSIPVGIWNGECMVDFAAIMEHIGFLFDLD
ncbi:MAG: Uma2 family endonuclease [Lachnospiraceae bacterium]|nr:Uma2 family endonuclease [Lachnospiraceae bacterium]